MLVGNVRFFLKMENAVLLKGTPKGLCTEVGDSLLVDEKNLTGIWDPRF